MEDYALEVLPSPIADASIQESIYACMCDVFAGDFASNGFGEDQKRRLESPGAVYAFARSGALVVSCAMMALDGDVGLVGGVCTRPEHRRKGLSKGLVGRLLEGESVPRFLILGTGSRAAAGVYGSFGFRGLNGSLGGAKGYNPEDEGEWIMLRDAANAAASSSMENVAFDFSAYCLPGAVDVEPLSHAHWGAAVLLLNASEAAEKMRAFGVAEGLNAELRLAQAVRDGDCVAVAVHRESRRIYGMAFRDKAAGIEVYNLGAPSIASALVAGLPSVRAEKGLKDDCLQFWERGFLAFPGLLSESAESLRREMDALMETGKAKATADWNAVNGDGAEFVLGVDGDGKPVDKVMKVQGAALASPSVLKALTQPVVLEKLKALYSHLGQEVPEHVDIFGTKFFPMWPGGTSVNWHQDCHYFGTGSAHVISCGIYLEDTDAENGCFRLIPASHTKGAVRHKPGEGEWAQGEWARPDEGEAMDLPLPAGSLVLFNAMLVHAAHKNSHATKTRYSIFGHFVAKELNFAWRGTDFSHGVYRDRHEVY